LPVREAEFAVAAALQAQQFPLAMLGPHPRQPVEAHQPAAVPYRCAMLRKKGLARGGKKEKKATNADGTIDANRGWNS
jgi:hypothetical protein